MSHRSALISLLTPAALALAIDPCTAQDAAAAAPAAQPATPPVHLIRFEGSYEDLPELGGDLTAMLLGGGVTKPKSFYAMRDELEALAKKDGATVLVDLSHAFGVNLPQLTELGRTFEKLRGSGKTLWAYLEGADTGTYQLAAMCDKVLIADLGMLDLPAPSLSVTFMKDAFDLLGVEFDVVRCGDFKGAVEPYMLSSMSKHLRDHYRAMVEHMNAELVQRIAARRKLTVERVREIQGQRMFSAQQALEAGLVDQIVPWRGAEFALGTALGDRAFKSENVLSGKKKRSSFNPMAMLSELFAPKKDEELEDEAIVVLHLSGTIVDGTKPAAGSIVSGPMVETIESVRDNDKVKGVVVRVNSPGGSATASEAILLALQELAAKKPVVVSMGALAASGGYYVTCLERPIWAEPGTITGSIGVFGMRPCLGPLMRRIGVRTELVALDESAGMTAIDRPWSEDEKGRIQAFVDRTYEKFVGHVARSRHKAPSEVLAIAGGRVWSGEQAVENGLVDHIGGLDDALAAVAKEAGVSDYVTEHMPRPKSFFDSFADDLMSARALLPDAAKLALARRTGLDQALRVFADALLSERPAVIWAMLPLELSVQ